MVISSLPWSSEDEKILCLSQRRLVWSVARVAENVGLSEERVRHRIVRLAAINVPVRLERNEVRFLRYLDLLSPDDLCSAMGLDRQALAYWWQIDSTNDACLRLETNSPVRFIVAESQSAGRGRRNNCWFADFAGSILFSYRHVASVDSDFRIFSLVFSLFVVEAICAHYPELSCWLKWPNDIYLGGKKWMGILVDIVHGMSTQTIIAGLGCNIRSDIVDQVESAVGLSSQTDEVDKNTLAQLLMQACIDASIYCETSDFSALVNRYNQYHLHHGQVINYRLEDQTHNAVVLGISVNGHLIVRNGDQDLYLHAEQISHVRSASSNRSAVYSLSDTRVS